MPLLNHILEHLSALCQSLVVLWYTMMKVSRKSNLPVGKGRGLRVKVNLPIFKDEKTKDAVTYHSWWWDVNIFWCSG